MKVILKNYVNGKASESHMEVVKEETTAVGSKLPEGSTDEILLKNLYLSCDPFMRGRMSKHDEPSYISDYIPGQV
ncbi:hypothetical protein LUZ60_004897 [Juncus effusus]|nr:hypothetical protein LUZ60_004897 [Juncus effusus]